MIDPRRYRASVTELAEAVVDDPFVSAEALRSVAKSRLASGTSLGPKGDFDLNPTAPRPASYIPAAVLIPVVARDTLHVLLTLRSDTLARHAGQIAFPGGRIDASDAGPVEAAIREAGEEVGLAPSQIEPLGTLQIYRTGTGFAITPVLALVSPDYTPLLQESEVAESFEVPFVHLMQVGNYELHKRLWQGVERQTYGIPFGERYIWGATAGILRGLQEQLFEPQPARIDLIGP